MPFSTDANADSPDLGLEASATVLGIYVQGKQPAYCYNAEQRPLQVQQACRQSSS